MPDAMPVNQPSPLVSVVRASPATVGADYVRLLELIGIDAAAELPARALLVPLRARRFPFPGAGAPPWQLEGVARALRAAGVTTLHALLPAPPDDLYGYAPVAAALGITRVSRVPAPDRTLLVTILAPCRVEYGDVLVGAMRGIESLSACGRRPSCLQRPAHSDAICFRRAGEHLLAVMDATTISDGRDRLADRAEVRGLLFASRDPLALDTVAGACFGIAPPRVTAARFLAQLHSVGSVGRHIPVLVGDTDAPDGPWGIAPLHHGALPSRDGNATLAAVLQAYRRLLRVRARRFARWTAADETTLMSWLRHTAWGRLFRSYQARAVARWRE